MQHSLNDHESRITTIAAMKTIDTTMKCNWGPVV